MVPTMSSRTGCGSSKRRPASKESRNFLWSSVLAFDLSTRTLFSAELTLALEAMKSFPA